MKKIIALLLAVVLCFALCACGGGSDTDTTNAPDAANTTSTTAAPETTAAPVSNSKKVAFGEKIALDFVEITFEESYIKEDISMSISDTSSSITITRNFGPSPEEGKQFICLKGKIKNLAKTELPVYDFFLGEFDIDGYKFEATANDCDIYTANGETESSVPPLTEYSFILYSDIPNELANSNEAISFRFGFYDMFDNAELSRNKAFEDDPISLCPYQYSITIK